MIGLPFGRRGRDEVVSGDLSGELRNKKRQESGSSRTAFVILFLTIALSIGFWLWGWLSGSGVSVGEDGSDDSGLIIFEK